MKRRYRVALTVIALASAVSGILLLTYAGPSTVGPLSRVLTGVSAKVSGAEARYVRRARGKSRRDALAWFTPLRDAAQLRTPTRILWGAFDSPMPASLEGVIALEKSLGATFPLLHFYSAWGDRPDEQFPLLAVRAIADLGSIPVITWEPWLADFQSRLHPDLPMRDQRDRGGLAAISQGAYDDYVKRWAADAAQYGDPLFVRWAHEMNDPYRYPWGPQNNRAADFVAAWRHVVQLFREAGATNVLFVWGPHVGYAGFNDYYPGDEYVDWVATGVLNFGTVAQWSQWWSFDEIFGKKYPLLARHNKPIMIAELGSLAVGGDRAQWYLTALRDLPKRYPLVKAVLFFNVAHDATVTYQALDWTIPDDSAVMHAVRAALQP